MLYIINFDIKDTTREDIFHKTVKDFGENIVFIPKCLFLDVKNEQINKDAIFQKIKEVLTDDDLFLISSVNFANMSGWLTRGAVDWLKNHK